MKRLVIGLLAHVDSGKTTLAEGLLYRAGVLTGSNGGRFKPDDTIRRSEAAAILTRMAVPSLRQKVEISTGEQPENVLSANEILEKCGPAVFKLTSYDARGNLLGMGSGVVLSANGDAVTCGHLVNGVARLVAEMADGSKREVSIYALDADSDIAHIRVVGVGLPYLETADSPSTGDIVYALGYPGGGAEKVTAGKVLDDSNGDYLVPMIETTASVVSGNSGGALVNTHGELVGINTLIKSQTGSYVGYSFAIPESIVRKVVVDLKEFGVVQRALLGVQFRVVDQDFLDTEGKELGIKDLGGAYVAAVVEGGAASEAGIRKGDVILDIDGVKIVEPSTLQEQIAKRRPNDTVKLSVKRDGKVKQFDVTLRNKAGKTELVTKEDVDVVDALGGKFADAGAKLCRELDIKGGVQVVGIKADGILARARVKQGFVITHINDRPVYSLGDMQRMTEKVRSIDGVYPNGRSASYTLVE